MYFPLENKKTMLNKHSLDFTWLGYLDSNQSIEGSEPTALPLGHTPKTAKSL